jgi:hypothetical protein
MRFAKAQEKKMGKPESATVPVVKRGPMKSPISKPWISTSPQPVYISSALTA